MKTANTDHALPRAKKLAALLRLGVPGALAGFACLAGAQQAAPADAEAVALNPVVVTGAPTATESFELPYSVDSVDLRANQAGNLGVNASEALAGVPGLVIQNRQNYAQDLQISVRGFGARAAFGVRGVKLIADGIPATNPDGQGQAATFNLDTAERIEVMRGPFATVYGNHAGGVIQLFSRKGEGDPRVRASVLGGSWGTTKFGIGAEGEKDGIGFVLDASRFDTDGYRDHSKTRRDQGFAKLTLNPDEDSTLTLVANGLRQPETEDPLGVTWETYERDPQSLTIDPLDTATPKRSTRTATTRARASTTCRAGPPTSAASARIACRCRPTRAAARSPSTSPSPGVSSPARAMRAAWSTSTATSTAWACAGFRSARWEAASSP